MTDAFVSVSMIAYKHADFIAEAINGVLSQNVDFPVELIITDDCSGDDTEKVVHSFASHPNYEWIKYFRHNKNLGVYENLKFNLEHCTGKFIAFCEGDDYWIDPLKLKKQAQVFEKYPEVQLVFTSRKIDNNGSFEENLIPEHRVTKSVFYLNGVTFPTQTMMIRNMGEKLLSFLELNKSSFGFDKLVGYFALMQGDAYAIPDVTAVYRHNGLGAWSRYTDEEKMNLHIKESLKFYKIITDHKIDPEINEDILKFNLFRRVIRTTLTTSGINAAKKIIRKYKPPLKAVIYAFIDYSKNKIRNL